MKVKWNEDSLRLAITLSELQSLRQSTSVAAQLKFPGNNAWLVTIKPIQDETTIIWVDGEVAIALAAKDIERLARPDSEGLYFQYDFQDGSQIPLRYFIEKDFPVSQSRALEIQQIDIRTSSLIRRKSHRLKIR